MRTVKIPHPTHRPEDSAVMRAPVRSSIPHQGTTAEADGRGMGSRVRPGTLHSSLRRLLGDPAATVLRIILVMMLLQLGGPALPANGVPTDGPGRAGAVSLLDGRSPAGFVPEWSWPLHPAPKVLRLFDKPAQNWKRGHRGVDLAVGAALPGSVVSPAAGVVSFAGTVVDRGVVSIDHGGGRISSFEPVDPLVVKGQRIAEGELVATVTVPATGGTGGVHCSESCLHWGVRVDGDYVDPLGLVMDRRPSVLLPLNE